MAADLKLGSRKAYALAKIDRAFQGLKVDLRRLRRIGWTKLAMLSPFVNAETVEQLLRLAEETPAHELKLILQGKTVGPDGKVVVFYLHAKDLNVLGHVLQQFGATKHPRGWLGKEAALMKALAAVMANNP